jgi:2-methylaconitate cis-trans-isomerase PrpF
VNVDYLFAQVGVDRAVVDLAGNCGNLTAAVGPYAVDEGLVEVPVPGAAATVVMLRNLNTGVRIRATVPLDGGRAAWRGSCAIDGVPGTGAPVLTEYLEPAGSVTGRLLPTGSAVDRVEGVDVSVVDVASPHVFVRAADLGIGGGEAPADLNGRSQLLARLESLRVACGRAIGVDSAAIPRLILVSAPATETADLRVRATSMQVVHHATPITGALCTAAAAVIPGTVAHAVARPGAGASGVVALEHAKGRVEATVELDEGGEVRAAGVVRTARRLLAGTAYVPRR